MKYIPWGGKSDLSDDEFYNRNYEIDNLRRLLDSTKYENAPNLLITGVRGVGKTVLLRKIKREMDEYLTIYIDFSRAEAYQSKKMSIIGLMQHYFKEIMKECEKNNLTTIITKLNKFFKTKNYKLKDFASIDKIHIPIFESEADTKKLMDFVLELPNTIYNENKSKFKGIIIFMDEFQIIKELDDYLESFLWILRSYIQDQKNVAYVISGSMGLNDELITTIAGQNGVFGGRMLTIHISPFSKETTKNYLKEASPDLFLTDDGFERFYKCTRGLPSYINTFARILPKNIELNDNRVKQEFSLSITAIDSHILALWTRLTLKEQKIIVSLLDKPLRRKEIATKLGVSSGSLSKALLKLQNNYFIIYNNGFYEISEQLLRVWLKSEYKNKGIYPYRD